MSSTDLQKLIAELRELEKHSQPAPWCYKADIIGNKHAEEHPGIWVDQSASSKSMEPHIALVIASRNALPKLLQVIEIYREALENYSKRRIHCVEGKATMILSDVPTVSIFALETLELGDIARTAIEQAEKVVGE